MTTTAARLNLGRYFWFDLIGELRKRGAGRRESGAFLLAATGRRRVQHAAYYDDLCPGCLDEGFIRFENSGYVNLTQICQSKGLCVVADVHTHPGIWTGQSEADRDHPMIPRAGHIALILPSFARSNRHNLRGLGAYLYCGDGRWSDNRPTVTLSGL
jgi:proteasome lid subunit RPN8/RPN11